MRKIQDRVLARIEQIAGEMNRELECAVGFDYSNTGEIVFYREFNPVGRLAFNFQKGYATFNPGKAMGTDRMLEYAHRDFDAQLRGLIERAVEAALIGEGK